MNKFLVILILVQLNISGGSMIDFGEKSGGQDWRALNDGVMGGMSDGVISFTESSLVFNGSISFANNGGFASFRNPFGEYDLSKFEKIGIRYKAKGQSFGFTLETESIWFRPYYKSIFASPTEEWEIVEIPLEEFDQYQIGEKTGRKISKKNLEEIIRFGIITNDKKEGPFELEIDYIKFE